jgi:hypothetical protein
MVGMMTWYRMPIPGHWPCERIVSGLARAGNRTIAPKAGSE